MRSGTLGEGQICFHIRGRPGSYPKARTNWQRGIFSRRFGVLLKSPWIPPAKLVPVYVNWMPFRPVKEFY